MSEIKRPSAERLKEPCGHAKNFLMGDEHGHFQCAVCQLERERGLRTENAERDDEALDAEQDVETLRAMAQSIIFKLRNPALVAEALRTKPPWKWRCECGRESMFLIEAACPTCGSTEALEPIDAAMGVAAEEKAP